LAVLAFLGVGYAVWIVILNLFSRKQLKLKIGDVPRLVSVLIFTRNEEEVIAKRIANLASLDYPRDKLEIVFSDNSVDNTREIIAGFRDSFREAGVSFSLLQYESGIELNEKENRSVPQCKGEIVFTGDAESSWHPEAIRNAVKYFSDDTIGGVTGQQVLTSGEPRSLKLEKTYKDFYYGIRRAESALDSTIHIHGDLFGFRRKLFRRIDPIKGANDANVAIDIRRQGYKVVHASNSFFYERAPVPAEQRVQKERRAALLLESMLSARDMLFKPRYGRFGTVVLPLDFFVLLVAPILQLALIPLLAVTFLYYWTVILSYSWFALGLFVVVFLFCWFNKAKVRAFVFLEFSLIKGFFRVISGKREWAKIESTRK